MQNKNAKIKTSKKKLWLRRILITLAVIILLPIGLFTIGWLNRDTVIESLLDWYQENNTGTLTIGKVNANFISGFPKVGFTLKDIEQTSTNAITDQYSTLYIEEAKVVIGAGNLLRGDIKFEKIAIKNAVFSSEVISERSYDYHDQLKRNKQRTQQKGFQLPEWLHKDKASIVLDNLKYITKDSILNKHFNFHIHKLEGSFKSKNLKLTGNTILDITINNLGFNTNKGSFGNGARIRANPNFTIDLTTNLIEILEFPLFIDAQVFKTNAHFDLSESNTYAFHLQNNDTDFRSVKGLLTDSLASKVKNYEILNPFQSDIKLAGTFAYGNNPNIEATFSTTNNELIIANKFQLKNAAFNGSLSNDIYATDSLRNAKRSSKDIKIAFDTIEAQIEGIKIAINNAYYQSSPDAFNFIEASINLEGNNESLATIIETDNFDFKEGRFQLNASISGDIPNPYQFLNKSSGNFKLNNTQVILKKNGLQLPIQTIELALRGENSTLKQLVINLPNGEQLVFKGQLKNISGLLSKDPKTPTTSRIFLDSENLNINEVLAMAKQFIPKSNTDLDDRKTLHETLDAVYSQFHPQFGINVDVLQYNDVVIKALKSNIDLVNSETILLRNFDFMYSNAFTNLKGSIVVHGPESELKDAIFMDAEATSNGSIAVFKDLFDIKLFRFNSGEFQFNGKVKGNIKEFNQLLNNARGDLILTNTKLYYEPAEMDLVIDSLVLFVDKSDILLKKFDIEIGDLYPITLNGSIKDFPAFLLDNLEDSGSVFLKITAPYLDGDNLLTTLKSFKNEEKIIDPTNKKALHTLFKDINTFNPKIELSIDSLKYSDLITEDIKALVYFENDSILKLNNLNLKYKETTASVQGTLNAHTTRQDLSNGNPFDLDFFINVEGKSEDLNGYLKTTNFIFKSGDFQFFGNYNAQSEDLDIMNSKTFGDLKIRNTLVDYKLANLQIPVDSLHLEIDDDLATLKALDIDLPGKSSVYFSGSIDHFSDFINNNTENNLHSSNFTITSPYLNTSDIKSFLKNSTLSAQKSESKAFNLENFKQALSGINTSFYPSVSMSIDTLSHKKLDVTDFGMDLYFDNTGNFKIEDTQFNFYGGSIAMTLDLGIETKTHIPVTIDMQAKDINIDELVTRFNYFDNEDLKNADKIEGNLNYTIKAKGNLGLDGKIDMGSINGTFQLELVDLALHNYKPVMDNSILMKDERFENLQFRPIVQTFKIKNGILVIPRTEIQSSAIHLFAEGSLKFNDYVDIWLSLPYKNLKSNDGLILPEKTTYDNAGPKFYIQLVKDKLSKNEKKRKLNVKVRLSNRKLRKQK